MSVDDLERVEVTSRAALRAWLAAHHARPEGVWLVTYKRHCGAGHLPWGDIVRELICFGWIDSRRRRLDDDRTSLMATPRKPGSVWSAVNKAIVAELTADGLIEPAGQARIDAAQADGSWTWLDDVEALLVPDDLAAALEAAGARAAWDAASKSARKGALYQIKSAKTDPTRTKRIARIAGRCAAGDPPA